MPRHIRKIVWFFVTSIGISLSCHRLEAQPATQPAANNPALRIFDDILASNAPALDSADSDGEPFSFQLAIASDSTTTASLHVWDIAGAESPGAAVSSPMGFVYCVAGSHFTACLDTGHPGRAIISDSERFNFAVTGDTARHKLDFTLSLLPAGTARVKLDIISFLKVLRGSYRGLYYYPDKRMLYVVTDRIIVRVRTRAKGEKGYPIEIFGIQSSDGLQMNLFDIRVGAEAGPGVSGAIDANRFAHLPGLTTRKPTAADHELPLPPVGYWNDFENRAAGSAVAKAIGWPAPHRPAPMQPGTGPAAMAPSAKEAQLQSLVHLTSAMLGVEQQSALAQASGDQERASIDRVFAQRQEALADTAAEIRGDLVEPLYGYLDASRLISSSSDLRRILSDHQYSAFARDVIVNGRLDPSFRPISMEFLNGFQAIGLSGHQLADASDALVDVTFRIEAMTWMYRSSLINAAKMKQCLDEAKNDLVATLHSDLDPQQCERLGAQLKAAPAPATTQPKDTGGL